MFFEWPHILYALILLLPAAWYWRVERRRQAAVAALLHAEPAPRAWALGRYVAACLLYLSLVVAAAGPRLPWERGADILFLVDISRSMQARHTCQEPTWLERAKFQIREVSDELPEARVGLVAFERFAFPVTQLTADRAWFGEVLEHGLYTGLMLQATQTDIGNALQVVAARKREQPENFGNVSRVVLLSDGGVAGNYRQRLRVAAEALVAENIHLDVIGVGNATDTPVLHSVDGQCEPRAIELGGEAVHVQLHDDVLYFIAETAGGHYYREDEVPALVAELRASLEPVAAGTAGRRDISDGFLLLAAGSLLVCLYLPSGHRRRRRDVRV